MTVPPAEGGYASPEVVGGSSCSSESQRKALGMALSGDMLSIPRSDSRSTGQGETTSTHALRDFPTSASVGSFEVDPWQWSRACVIEISIYRGYDSPTSENGRFLGGSALPRSRKQPASLASVRRGLVRRPSTPRRHAPSS